MNRYSAASERTFDVMVIGAGMFGACIAHSAVQSGHSVVIIDKDDFGAATSSNHFKMIHGGIRYLQHLDFPRLRESSRDRSTLLKVAPHLTKPLPIVFPTYGFGRRSKAIMRAAMLAYDVLSLDRNQNIEMKDREIPNGAVLGRQETLDMFPGIKEKGLTGAAVFFDGQIYNPARLVLSFIRSAISKGAVALNHTIANSLLRDGKKITGCRASDVATGKTFDIRAKIVVNATGPWGSMLLNESAGLNNKRGFSFSRDLAFVVDREISSTHAIGCQIESTDSDAVFDRGGRHLFLVPWRGMTLVGVWHRIYEAGPDNLKVSYEEMQQYLEEINTAYAGLDFRMEDITRINTGLVLFGTKADQRSTGDYSFAKRSIVVDHIDEDVDGLITVVGVRATVASSVAEETVDMIHRKLGGKPCDKNNRWEPLFGGHFADFNALAEEIRQKLPTRDLDLATAIARNYGSEYGEMLSCAPDDSYLMPIGQTNVVAAEIINAIRNEMAMSLEDVVLRRTELATGGNPGNDVIEKVAAIVGEELNWSVDQTNTNVRLVQALIERRGPWTMVDLSDQIEASGT